MLTKKLAILKNSNIIDEEIVAYLNYVIGFMGEYTDGDINKLDAFITHLAMALSRIKKGEVSAEMNELLYEQIKSNEHFLTSHEIWQELEKKAPIVFPKPELNYIYLHLCTLLEQN